MAATLAQRELNLTDAAEPTSSAVHWTDEQRRAIQIRDVSVALSAGAGCGKTSVLSERFLSHLEPQHADGPPPAALNELVAITFTDRAAREMLDRIRQGCLERLQAATGPDAAHWHTVLRELDAARISTIHSFCAGLLRSHAVEAGVDPRFDVLQPLAADTLLYETIDDQLRRHLADQDPGVMDLVAWYGLEQVSDKVTSLLGSRPEIDFDRWLATTPDDLVALWADFARTKVQPKLARQIMDSPEAAAILDVLRRDPPRNEVMSGRAEILLRILPALDQQLDIKAAFDKIDCAARVEGIGTKAGWECDSYRKFKESATALRKKVDVALKKSTFSGPAESRVHAEAGLALLKFAKAVHDDYEQRKAEVPALDFDDLLVRAKRLLNDPAHRELRRRLASRVSLLLVDEFQDTDSVQVDLVKALCGEQFHGGKLFFVGDHKQSIYHFRGAEPRVFHLLRGEMPAEGRLPLTLNFRSQPAILHFVNALFHNALGAEYEPLRPHHAQVGPTPAVEFLWARHGGGRRTAGAAAAAREREADWIARRLRTMLDEGECRVRDTAANSGGQSAVRAARPGDIAILFRALTDVDCYERALREHGIDYYLVGGHAFYSQQEIFDVTNLLRALASPNDEISLAGALRSPIFSLSDETLFWLAQRGNLAVGLFDASPPPQLDAEQKRRVRFAAATIGELRACKDRIPVAELINLALARTGYDAVLLAEFLGPRKLANLRKLVDQAREFDQTGVFTLADFVVQLSHFIARLPKEAPAPIQPEAGDVVRLMSIHQAKGLEFPVVVVPDLDRRENSQSPSAVLSPELGPLVKRPEDAGGNESSSGLDLHNVIRGDEERAETARLLYVAATRAADYLIFASSVYQPHGEAKWEEPHSAWMKMLAERFEVCTGKYCNSLPADYVAPEVLVTLAEPGASLKKTSGRRRADFLELAARAKELAGKGGGTIPSWIGPLPADRAARRQYSFSRLSGRLLAQSNVEATPIDEFDPTAAPAVDSLALGTLVHSVLSAVSRLNPADVRALVRRRAEECEIESAEVVDEAVEMIARFLESQRAAQLNAAAEVHAELEFLLRWPPDSSPSDGLFLRGFIDCLYRDDQGWHIVDYKTNRTTAAKMAVAAEAFEMQMQVYALAAEQILGTPPVELVLHFLRPAAEHRFPWDDTARRRVVDLVNRTIQVDQGQVSSSAAGLDAT